jgi:hypothetical protein
MLETNIIKTFINEPNNKPKVNKKRGDMKSLRTPPSSLLNPYASEKFAEITPIFVFEMLNSSIIKGIDVDKVLFVAAYNKFAIIVNDSTIIVNIKINR